MTNSFLVSAPARRFLLSSSEGGAHETSLIVPELLVKQVTYFRCLVDVGVKMEEHAVVLWTSDLSIAERGTICRVLKMARPTQVSFARGMDASVRGQGEFALSVLGPGFQFDARLAASVAALSVELGHENEKKMNWMAESLPDSRRAERSSSHDPGRLLSGELRKQSLFYECSA